MPCATEGTWDLTHTHTPATDHLLQKESKFTQVFLAILRGIKISWQWLSSHQSTLKTWKLSFSLRRLSLTEVVSSRKSSFGWRKTPSARGRFESLFRGLARPELVCCFQCREFSSRQLISFHYCILNHSVPYNIYWNSWSWGKFHSFWGKGQLFNCSVHYPSFCWAGFSKFHLHFALGEIQRWLS